MLKKGKTYTLEEFEEIFNEAVLKVLENLQKEMTDKRKEKGLSSPLADLAFTMQNTVVASALHHALFDKED